MPCEQTHLLQHLLHSIPLGIQYHYKCALPQCPSPFKLQIYVKLHH